MSISRQKTVSEFVNWDALLPSLEREFINFKFNKIFESLELPKSIIRFDDVYQLAIERRPKQKQSNNVAPKFSTINEEPVTELISPPFRFAHRSKIHRLRRSTQQWRGLFLLRTIRRQLRRNLQINKKLM